VRELENAVLRAVSLCDGDAIGAADLGLRTRARQNADADSPSESLPPTPAANVPMIDFTRSFVELKRETVTRFEREYLMHLLDACDGNVSRAARRARKDRRDFRRLLRKHALDPRTFERTCA